MTWHAWQWCAKLWRFFNGACRVPSGVIAQGVLRSLPPVSLLLRHIMRLPLEARASLMPQKSAISCRIAAVAKQAPDTANNRLRTGAEQVRDQDPAGPKICLAGSFVCPGLS